MDNYTQEFLTNFSEKGFLPGIQTITRPSTDDCNKGSCIDNYYIKLTEHIDYKAYKLTELFTDHYPIFLAIKKFKIKPNKTYDTCIDYKLIKNKARSFDWNSIENIHDPNVATVTLINMIKNCTQQATKIKKIKDVRGARKKWITSGIIISCQRKEQLFLLWKKDIKNETLKKEYKNYVKILDIVIKNAKYRYEQKIIEENVNDKKKLWKVINQKLGKGLNKSSDIKYILDDSNKKIEEPNGIANTMNTYFCNIGIQLSNKINVLQERIKYPPINPSTIFIVPTNPAELANIILNLKLKSGGVDEINTRTIKVLSDFIINPLVHIINLSIEKSTWPDVLKKAEIIPIHKAGNKHLSSN